MVPQRKQTPMQWATMVGWLAKLTRLRAAQRLAQRRSSTIATTKRYPCPSWYLLCSLLRQVFFRTRLILMMCAWLYHLHRDCFTCSVKSRRAICYSAFKLKKSKRRLTCSFCLLNIILRIHISSRQMCSIFNRRTRATSVRLPSAFLSRFI